MIYYARKNGKSFTELQKMVDEFIKSNCDTCIHGSNVKLELYFTQTVCTHPGNRGKSPMEYLGCTYREAKDADKTDISSDVSHNSAGSILDSKR